MTSFAQIDANRKNATLFSTGPRTPFGKSRVRLNAMRHGLTGQVTAMSSEDRAAHDELTAAIVKDLAPKTTMELHLARAVATDTWRLHRIAAIEENIFAIGQKDSASAVNTESDEVRSALVAARVFQNDARQFQLLSLYEQRINRNLHKNLKALQEMQAERRKQELAASREPKQISTLPEKPATTAAPHGFVFQPQNPRLSRTAR